MSRQPVVRHNDWGALTPPDLGDWEPTLSVTVVVPTFNYQRTLPYVLAGLAAQSYPAHLLEVVVVDDQSSPTQELPEVRPDNTRLIRVEEGWGRANACHLGALAAEGDVLHWYDADMLAYREEVEAHARWHHLVDYAVPGGDKRFVDPTSLFDLDPAVVRDRVAAGGAADLFPGEEHEPHQWVEDYWAKTDDLRAAGPRAQRFHIGMTGSVSKALYFDSDGFDRTLRLGEDMHLGHSLAQAGGVFVVERAARSWHLGRSQVLRRAEQVNRYNDPYLADLVPTMRPKRNRRGRAYQVPYLEVVVTAGPADETVHLVDSLLDGDVPDLRVTLVGPVVVRARRPGPARRGPGARDPHRAPLLPPRAARAAGRDGAGHLRRGVRADAPRPVARPAAGDAGGPPRRPRAHPPRRPPADVRHRRDRAARAHVRAGAGRAPGRRR